MCRDQQRDPVTGQFVKGRGGNPATRFTKSNAADMARKAAQSRVRNLHGRELVRRLLELGVTDPVVRQRLVEQGFATEELTQELAMHQRQIEAAIKKGDPRNYEKVLKAAGYLDGDTINVTVSGSEDAAPVIVFREQ